MPRAEAILTPVAKAIVIGVALGGWMALRSTASQAAPQRTDSCARLTTLTLANAAITSAKVVDSATFAPLAATPPAAGSAPPAAQSRTFCRVEATLTPTPDSDIKIEVWLPGANWNQKFQAVGNGGFLGAINYAAMTTALNRGYATASTDTGHTGGSGGFALGHPEKAVDFGWRAVHEMTTTAKRIVSAYYERAPRLSYWTGCSAGGRQALQEAQRFPSDYDGIVAGAPGLDWTGRAAQALHIAQRLERNEAARLTQAQTRLLHTAVLQACDAQDGVKDGVLDDPRRCTFDPAVLQCKGAADGSCLTAAQTETARLIYSAQTNPKTRRAIPGLYRGSELGWTDLGWSVAARSIGLDQFRFLVFKDPQWSLAAFDLDADLPRAEDADRNTINALNPNLRPFVERGGKLIQYHGWNDPQISPGISVQYYERAVDALGGSARSLTAYRLFMAPGMGHCSGGEGPSLIDAIGALEQWVERGTAPDQLVALRRANGITDRSRPLCPYPQVALYKGAGSTDDAANFACGVR